MLGKLRVLSAGEVCRILEQNGFVQVRQRGSHIIKTMNTNIVAKVTAEGKLEIPPEVLIKLQPLTEYEVLVTEDEIVFKKISKQLTWAELSEKIATLGVDDDEPTLQEISEMVKEMRQERRSKK